ncbi:hypothetical protein M8Z33_13520 [Streptomyces sp. ZAF1911]|uniref:hypothetical protein n=1 Tax=Streptomyces sp. ZAF1911 TaxID=2944129 RepID=UPI00237B76BA|nr:hypothetical protein [Streptomyces sp. ZAF1911]MDD9377659.1 hypothetical protein [Streptomyces sp. ZAF1911]
MSVNGNETTTGETTLPERSFMALPDRTEAKREPFTRCLEEVVRILGLAVALEPQPGGPLTWEHRARTALRQACRHGMDLSEAAFDALAKAAVHDPDPSFNRGFIEPALNAFGHRRVQYTLLGYLRTGTDMERAGAARAWYWSALPLRMPRVRAESPGSTGQTDPDDGSSVVAEWNEAALREFVSNEHVDVRRCILPGLPLRKSAFPPELHDLVDAAVAVARSHPDEYIRHRVEHQVGG